MIIKITIPDILVKMFKFGNTDDREAVVNYICDMMDDKIYDAISEEVDNGKN